MLKAKGSRQTTTSTQQTGPSAMAQPFWNEVYGGAHNAYGATSHNPADIYAPPTAAQTGAAGNLINWAQGPHPELGNYNTAIEQLKSGYAPLDVSGAIHSASQPYYQQLMEKILPSARSSSIANGAYDSPRSDITSGQLIRDYYTNPVEDIIGKYTLDEQQRERDYALNAGNELASLTGQQTAATLAPQAIMGQAGEQQQKWAQDQLTANQSAPWAGLGEYAQLLQALPSTTTSGTQTQQQSGGGFFGDLFKGLLGAATLFAG